MLEENRYCIDVLHQIAAVEGALERSRRAILEEHLRTCVAAAYADGRVDDVLEELLVAFFGGRAPGPGRPAGESPDDASNR
jgi:DNA-binding FrmR family transcriptional regulator